MESLIIEHAGAVATLMGFMFAAILALLAFMFRDLWARVAKAPKEYVTKEQMAAAITKEIGGLSKDIEKLSAAIEQASTRLAQGDGCFEDFERAFRVVLMSLDRFCQAWEAKFQENMHCAELRALVRDIHGG